MSELRNPTVWILGALLAFSIYSHYRTSAKFEQACTLVDLLFEIDDLEASGVVGKVRLAQLCHERLAPPGDGSD